MASACFLHGFVCLLWFPMVFEWFLHGLCIFVAYFLYGFCMVSAWFLHGYVIVCPSFQHMPTGANIDQHSLDIGWNAVTHLFGPAVVISPGAGAGTE